MSMQKPRPVRSERRSPAPSAAKKAAAVVETGERVEARGAERLVARLALGARRGGGDVGQEDEGHRAEADPGQRGRVQAVDACHEHRDEGVHGSREHRDGERGESFSGQGRAGNHQEVAHVEGAGDAARERGQQAKEEDGPDPLSRPPGAPQRGRREHVHEEHHEQEAGCQERDDGRFVVRPGSREGHHDEHRGQEEEGHDTGHLAGAAG